MRCKAVGSNLTYEGTKLHFKQMNLDICERLLLKTLRVENVFIWLAFCSHECLEQELRSLFVL